MTNIAHIKLGLVAVSRDCFPAELSLERRKAVAAACRALGLDIIEANTLIQNENDVITALNELNAAGANALCVYLGNFGPEAPETLLAKHFGGPVMFAAAAEESASLLLSGRGDAFCGMLNASYNAGLRGIRPYIPSYPVGTADEIAGMMAEFIPIARVLLGIANLKIITFGPRPADFFACNAPIKPLYDLGIEIQENSELDLYAAFNAHQGDSRIKQLTEAMAEELGSGNRMPGILPKLAQLELTLEDWMGNGRGMRRYIAFANKCWPSFQTQFGCVPCYVNSRFTSRLIPVACEVDIYGALSEYILAAATGLAPTLLDINNTVPYDMYKENVLGHYDYSNDDLFMGFHCGNTPSCHLISPQMKHQLIMHRLLEPGKEPNISRGTLEGDLKPGDMTFFRLQGTADCALRAYVAQGEILPIATQSFGGIGVFAVPQMARFYRHVLLEKRYPHHGGVAFCKAGKALFNALKLLGIDEIDFNRPSGILYNTENPYR